MRAKELERQETRDEGRFNAEFRLRNAERKTKEERQETRDDGRERRDEGRNKCRVVSLHKNSYNNAKIAI